MKLHDERGLTLVELLVTVVIMGIAFTAVLGGMFTVAVSSDIHRRQAVATVALRSFAETVKQEAYVQCATTTSYGASYAAPSGYTASVTGVEYYVYDSTTPDLTPFSSTCPATDQGLQRLSLRVVSADARAAERVQVLKRCAGARPIPCP